MKEIKKFSQLLDSFVFDINKQMEKKNKDINAYTIWEKIRKKDDVLLDVILEDIKDSIIVLRVRHPGIAQQIRMKEKKIISIFNKELPKLKLIGIDIIIHSVFMN